MSELLPEQTGDEASHGWGDQDPDESGNGLRADPDGELAAGTRDAAWYDEERPPHHDRH
ncbi:MAG: hypothetical protein M3467_07005 [Actinomycetota bacterium]|jgi:hypothetical protein|nr:hypothetical protein [Actinomycetota bacterium]